ncbi:MAG: sugar phosphate isomerase/epimerase [Pedosphaera sp.]|nr:sugar phosphate isomerase/epimerase [Pedosphaera sp.]
MIQSAVTISLVPEARGGPFVFRGDLPQNCARASALGFNAVEIFPRSPDSINAKELQGLLRDHNLKLAAMGTGAGWVVHQLRLTDPSSQVRARAKDFVASLVDFAAAFGAPAIVGSMQGKWEADVSREQAIEWLREALDSLGPRAHSAGVPLFFEHLNRYETNLVNTVAQGLELLAPLRTKSVKLLCDLFHMNIEEQDVAGSLREAGSTVGHIHFADTNRRAIGYGHLDVKPIATALHEIGYSGFVSAEIVPLPDGDSAASQTMRAFNQFFRGDHSC